MTRKRINDAGLALIKEFEGFRSRAYRDPIGVWTIGYGHTRGVRPGDVITQDRADAYLRDDVRIAEADVERGVEVQLVDNQFSALVSFVFNVGGDAFRKSTLLRLLNAGGYTAVPGQLARWTKAGGRELPGLVRRREAEARLWRTPDQARKATA